MDVLVERYQRRKYVNQEDAPMLYYIRQKAGNVRVMDVDTMAAAIESKSSLTAGDVKHTISSYSLSSDLINCSMLSLRTAKVYASFICL